MQYQNVFCLLLLVGGGGGVATRAAYGSSQAKDPIRAAAAVLRHSHANARPLTHCEARD